MNLQSDWCSVTIIIIIICIHEKSTKEVLPSYLYRSSPACGIMAIKQLPLTVNVILFCVIMTPHSSEGVKTDIWFEHTHFPDTQLAISHFNI